MEARGSIEASGILSSRTLSRNAPTPTGDSAYPIVETTAPTAVERCCQCGLVLSAPGCATANGWTCCSARCLKARTKAARHGPVFNLSHPNLPFDSFRAQRLFAPVDLTFPGLQLIHERPFIFLVHSFLSAAECDLLLEKAQASVMRQQLVGESEASHRTSTGCVTRREEVPGFRRRVCQLTNVGEDQLQPLKISCYAPGQAFAEHCDAIDGNGVVDEDADYYADRARQQRGTRQCPHPGANRFMTLFVYLNDVAEGGGGCTGFRWVGSAPSFYEQPSPSGMGVTRLAPPDAQVSIRPERGMAVLHFPSTTAETGGFTDRNASHESSEARQEKWVCQQFIWSHAIRPDALKGTVEPAAVLSESVF